MKRNFKRIISAAMSMLMIAGTFPAAAFGAVENGWEEVDGRKYWYESGVKQGTEGRGKEIYDPGSDAWYWLDSVDGGAMAYSKDLFQESSAGQWAGSFVEGDWKASTGKWVRYDENGHMIKGWYENENGRYYFDETYGTMAKGYAVIKNENGQYIEYYFDVTTGILLRELGETPEQGWKNVEGIDVWYENHIRQGYSIDESYRGKEIYDPGSDAWYWLDNVDGGKKAVSKDVYQESQADDAGNIGKWVHYDADGHMVKGWYENEEGQKYYFDPTYGTMAKGEVTIDGESYNFDDVTGVLEDDENDTASCTWKVTKESEVLSDGSLSQITLSEYDSNGNLKSLICKMGASKAKYDNTIGTVLPVAASEEDMDLSYKYTYEYDESGVMTKKHLEGYSFGVSAASDENGYSSIINYHLANVTDTVYTGGKVSETETTNYASDGTVTSKTKSVYTYDSDGNASKAETYDGNGKLTSYRTYTYENGKMASSEKFTVSSNRVTERVEYKYDDNGYDYVEEVYSCDESGNAQKTYSYYYTYYAQTAEDGSVSTSAKTYDVYYGSTYNNGYEYIRELDGNSLNTVKYIKYTSKNGEKTVRYYSLYNKLSFPSDAEEGQSTELERLVYYNANNEVMYKVISEYKLMK